MKPVVFRMAPQSTGLLLLTTAILPLPLLFFGMAAVHWQPIAVGVGCFMLGIWAYIWFWMRPSRFVVTPDGLRVEWPLRSELFPRAKIERVEHVDGRAFRQRYGYGMRIGAGGLWGGFGLYKTKTTTFRFYVSRLDDFVIVHMTDRPLLITPRDPAELTRLLQETSNGAP